MCGRHTHDLTWEQIHRLYQLTLSQAPSNLERNFNVCPTDPASVVLERDGVREFARMRWGLVPGWWSKPLKELRLATFNARAETVQTKPFFKGAFKSTRCLMPVSGYYEWHYPDGPKQPPQPYYFTRRDGQVMTIAGLWDEWRDKADGKTIPSCTMIITVPNQLVAEVHDRMPVVLEADQFETWLKADAKEAAELMKPVGEDVLQKWPVSKRINSSRTPGDDPTLIEEVKLAPQAA